MTLSSAIRTFKDSPARRMYDRWMKDGRVRSIDIKLVKLTVAEVLADLAIRTDTLAIGRPSRTARRLIEIKLLHEAGISEAFFFVLVQRELRSIRGVRAANTTLAAASQEGYLTFIYKP